MAVLIQESKKQEGRVETGYKRWYKVQFKYTGRQIKKCPGVASGKRSYIFDEI
jgi:hypothetical protein